MWISESEAWYKAPLAKCQEYSSQLLAATAGPVFGRNTARCCRVFKRLRHAVRYCAAGDHPVFRAISHSRAVTFRLSALSLFCTISGLSVALRSLGGAPATLYQVVEVKPHVFVWVPDDILDQDTDPQFRRAGTAGFIIGSDAVVVINAANSPFHARELLYEIRQRTDKPIQYVIDTDSDGEHTLGNEVFVDERAAILSTVAVQDAMRRYSEQFPERLRSDWRLQTRMRGFHPTQPSETFEGEKVLHLGSQPGHVDAARAGDMSYQDVSEVKLIQLSRAAFNARGSPDGASGVIRAEAPISTNGTGSESGLPGDLAVYVPGAKVLFLGDLFENAYYPRFGPLSHPRDIRVWIQVLRNVQSWQADVYIPGHGGPGTTKEVGAFRQFLEWLANEVETRIKEGKNLERVETELRAPLAAYHWHAPELAVGAVDAVYNQLSSIRTRTFFERPPRQTMNHPQSRSADCGQANRHCNRQCGTLRFLNGT